MSSLAIVGDPTSAASLPRLALEVARAMGVWRDVNAVSTVPSGGQVFLASGEHEERHELMGSIDADRLVALAHPTAWVSPSATLGRNVMISAQAVVMMDATVGDGTVVNSLSSVEHDNVLGVMTFLGTGVTLCGGVRTGEYAFVGGGAVVKPGVTIGARCTVGTGAVVIGDTPPGSTVVGNPARELRPHRR